MKKMLQKKKLITITSNVHLEIRDFLLVFPKKGKKNTRNIFFLNFHLVDDRKTTILENTKQERDGESVNANQFTL